MKDCGSPQGGALLATLPLGLDRYRHVSPKQYAELTGVCVETVERAIRSGRTQGREGERQALGHPDQSSSGLRSRGRVSGAPERERGPPLLAQRSGLGIVHAGCGAISIPEPSPIIKRPSHRAMPDCAAWPAGCTALAKGRCTSSCGNSRGEPSRGLRLKPTAACAARHLHCHP